MQKPDKSLYDPYYHYYVDLVWQENLLEALKASHADTQNVLKDISEEKGNYRYAPEKWSIKEVIRHLIDAERIFAYRALRFSRQDNIELPGYDHDRYVSLSFADQRQLKDLAREFETVRAASIELFGSMNEEMLKMEGVANKKKTTVSAIGFVIAGHEIHHVNVIREKYL